MKTLEEFLSICPCYETPNGNDALGYFSVLEAMRQLAIQSYDEGFKYAAEQFKVEPKGEPVKSIGEYIDYVCQDTNQ